MTRLAVIISCSIAVLLSIGAGIIVTEVYRSADWRPNQVVIVNHASASISEGEVHAFGQRYGIHGLAVGETASITIPQGGEGGYFVNVQFQSRRTLSSEELGYLTSGISQSHVVDVQDDTIILVESKVAPRPR
jgi:hypothetical protein